MPLRRSKSTAGPQISGSTFGRKWHLTLTILYCYYFYIGRWKEFGPKEIIELKRESDDIVYTNRILFDKAFIAAYERMMKEMFKPFQGWRKDAKLRTWKVRPKDNEPGLYTFTGEDNRLCIHKAYWDFQIQAAKELDIVAEVPETPKMNQDIPGLPAARILSLCGP